MVTAVSETSNLKFCMLLPRCNPIQPRLRCVLLLRDFYATRARLRKPLDPPQTEPEPITTKTKKLPSLKKKSRKFRKERWKERKAAKDERLSAPAKLSSLLRLHTKSARHPRTVKGADGLNTPPGQLGSEKDGGSPCSLYVVSSFASQDSQFLMGIEGMSPTYPYFIRVA